MRKSMFMLILFGLVIAFAACKKEEAAKLAYPETKKVDQVDDYFGTKVADPYRWLEDDNAEDTKAWVEAQNKVTFGYLDQIPYRPAIKARLTEIFNYPRYSSPFRVGENYFFYKNDGLQNQSVCYVQKGLAGAPEVFFDPNALSPDGTIRVGIIGPSNNDKLLAVSRGEAGSDWSEIRVMDIATKQELPDRVQWVKFSGAAWHGDGFYYSGYDKPAAGDELKAKNEFQKVFYHKLGDPQEKDVLVWEDKEHPLRYVGAGTTEGEEWLMLAISEGTSGSEVWVKDLAKKNAPFTMLFKGFEFDASPLEVVDGKFLVHTNADAPNFRVVAIDPANPAKENWQTVIPEKPEVLSGAGTAGGYLFTNYLKDANTKIYQHTLDGAPVREIELPALGSAGGFGGKRDEKVMFYTFTSFTYPSTIYKFDPATGASEVFRKPEVKFDPSAYETKQVFYASKDGTKVPMFIVYKKGLKLNGKNPTYLTAYGGFNISLTPSFSPVFVPLLENGGVFAQPNLRGGGEYGETWHKGGGHKMAGMKRKIRCGEKPMTAIVLAGGRGRRMKADKAGLEVGGRTLLEHVLDQLEPYFDEVLVCVSAGQAVKAGTPSPLLVEDLAPGLGPIGGLLAGLTTARHDACAIVACDIPEIDIPLLRSLARAAGKADIAVPVGPSGLREPLFAIYRRSVVPHIEALLARGERSLLPLYDRCRTAVVRFDDAARIRNLNTRDEYESYLASRDERPDGINPRDAGQARKNGTGPGSRRSRPGSKPRSEK